MLIRKRYTVPIKLTVFGQAAIRAKLKMTTGNLLISHKHIGKTKCICRHLFRLPV